MVKQHRIKSGNQLNIKSYYVYIKLNCVYIQIENYTIHKILKDIFILFLKIKNQEVN